MDCAIALTRHPRRVPWLGIEIALLLLILGYLAAIGRSLRSIGSTPSVWGPAAGVVAIALFAPPLRMPARYVRASDRLYDVIVSDNSIRRGADRARSTRRSPSRPFVAGSIREGYSATAAPARFGDPAHQCAILRDRLSAQLGEIASGSLETPVLGLVARADDASCPEWTTDRPALIKGTAEPRGAELRGRESRPPI
jgi:hypothetical protein